MNIKKCRQCGKVFQFIRSPFCPACLEAIDEQYKVLRDYLDEHPKAQIPQMAKGTGISEKIILYLLRDGRLTLSAVSLSCERCKAPIESGRFCGSCASVLEKELTSAARTCASKRTDDSGKDDAGRYTGGRTGTASHADAKESGMHIHRKNRRI